MNEMAGIRQKLRRVLGPGIPDEFFEEVSEDAYISGLAKEYLEAETDWERADRWGPLEDAVRRALRFWNRSEKTTLKRIQSGPHGVSQDMRDAEDRDTGKRLGSFDVWELFSDRTKAMTGAMSALFAHIGDQIPEVREFRKKVLPGRFLTADEARTLSASTGSVVDELHELAVEVADAFDWPGGSKENRTGTRPRSESAEWFILTGEAPQVRPIDARWELTYGSKYLSPQWRIHLTIPPWLPEEEVIRAFRSLRRQRPEGRQMPKTAKPLEVARFVWKREREEGYRERAPWTKWAKDWNDKHPGHTFNTASDFRMYFLRGSAAVAHLNLDSPNFGVRQRGSSGSA